MRELRGLLTPDEQVRPAPVLSAREREVLQWAAHGKTYKDICEITGIKFCTVKTYLDITRHKLGAVNVTNAVAIAIRGGLIK